MKKHSHACRTCGHAHTCRTMSVYSYMCIQNTMCQMAGAIQSHSLKICPVHVYLAPDNLTDKKWHVRIWHSTHLNTFCCSDDSFEIRRVCMAIIDTCQLVVVGKFSKLVALYDGFGPVGFMDANIRYWWTTSYPYAIIICTNIIRITEGMQVYNKATIFGCVSRLAGANQILLNWLNITIRASVSTENCSRLLVYL